MTCELFASNIEGAVESTHGVRRQINNESVGVTRVSISALAAAFGLPDIVSDFRPLKRLAEHSESGWDLGLMKLDIWYQSILCTTIKHVVMQFRGHKWYNIDLPSQTYNIEANGQRR